MHSHSTYHSLLRYVWWCVLIVSVTLVSVWWRHEREQFSALQAYQKQLTHLQQLATELATQSGNDALIAQAVVDIDASTKELLQQLPEAQKNTWSATQARAVGSLFPPQEAPQRNNGDAYTELTSRLLAILQQPTIDFPQAVTLRQQYAQLRNDQTQPAQFARVQHNYLLLEQRLNLQARQTILEQTTQTNTLLQQAQLAIQALLEDNKRLITFLEQAPVLGTDQAQELLDCRASLLQAFRREQKEAVAVRSMLTLAQEAQSPILHTCLGQRENCLTTPKWPARHTWLQEVSSGVVVLAEKYAQLHTIRAQGAPLDAQQLCVRRNKLPQNTNDLQDSLERALEQRDALITPQWATGEVIDQSGSTSIEKMFDDRQGDALQDIEKRQQQWIQETESSSGDTFRERLQKFFEQFDGKW
jgi:hypothetical protein